MSEERSSYTNNQCCENCKYFCRISTWPEGECRWWLTCVVPECVDRHLTPEADNWIVMPLFGKNCKCWSSL